MTFDAAQRAIKTGRLDLLKTEIPANLSASTVNRFGWSLLMLAALEGNSKIGAFLIEQGADVNALNQFGESALSLAAHKGHLPFVRLMKGRGASASVRPHGHDLATWLQNASGLPARKIDAILAVL